MTSGPVGREPAPREPARREPARREPAPTGATQRGAGGPEVDTATPRITAVDVDGVRTVAAGTAAWAVALVTLVLLRDRAAAAGHGSWVWICLAGVLLGLVGLGYCRRRRDRLRSVARDTAGTQPPAPSEPGPSPSD